MRYNAIMKRADHTRNIVVPERVRLRADPLALAHEYCQLLARETGLAEASIRDWGFIERVSSGLYIYAYGSREHGQPFFKTAQRLLDT